MPLFGGPHRVHGPSQQSDDSADTSLVYCRQIDLERSSARFGPPFEFSMAVAIHLPGTGLYRINNNAAFPLDESPGYQVEIPSEFLREVEK